MPAEVSKSAGRNNVRFIKRPDDTDMKKETEHLRQEIKKLDLSNNEINNQINKTVTDSKTNEKKKELQKKLKDLASKQGSIKAERNEIFAQIKSVDAQVKRKVNEIQSQTSKHNFKNVQEIDARVNYLDQLVDAGELKLADERRFVKEMSALRKLRKDFGSIEKQQESIDKDKAKIAELKQKLNTVQNKELQQEFEKTQKELDQINDSNKGILDKRNELFKKRNTIKKSKDEKYDRIRKLRAEHDAEFEKFKTALAQEKKKREEEVKKHEVEQKQQKKKEAAQKELDNASVPAFSTEISLIHSLLSYFDPSYVRPKPKAPLPATNGEAKSSGGRKIEMPQDVVVIRKDQESFFEGAKSDKSSKLKKNKSKHFTIEPNVIVALGDLSISLPTQASDVPTTIQTLKDTLKALEEKQDEQTKVNIEKAKAKIEKLAHEEKQAEEQTAN